LIINNQSASVISGHTRVGTARGVCNSRFLGKFGLRERAKLALVRLSLGDYTRNCTLILIGITLITF